MSNGGPPMVVRAIGTEDQFSQIDGVGGVSATDHGQRRLDDERWSIFLLVDSQAALDQVRAIGLEVTVLLTPEQVLAQNAQIAAELGDTSVGATGDVRLAFAPPFSDQVPDDFALTVQPSVGSPTAFGKGDLTDAGDGLLSVTITNPAAGVRYSAQAQSASQSIDVTIFEDFELHQLVAALVTPSISPQIPAFIDPFVFLTDQEDADADSQPQEPEEVDPAKMAALRAEAGAPLPNA